MTFQTPKGTRDWPPEEMRKLQFVTDTLRRVFEKYGFQSIDTPAFESFDVLAAKGGAGEAIKEEIYYFKDKSDREIGLRFDLTVPLARFIINNPNIPKPFKRYAIGKAWRYDNPQAQRYREFWMADVDIVGSNSLMADAECLSVAVECMRSLGFKKFYIRVNNRKFLESLFMAKGIQKDRIVDLFRTIDKLDKLGEEGVLKELAEKGFDGKNIITLINGGYKKEYSKVEGALELEELMKLAKVVGIGKNLKIDLSLVRGLEYYTGPVFEVFAGGTVSCGGGGRYDRLIKNLGGPDLPATGISFGLDRLVNIMTDSKMFRLNPKTICMVAPVNDRSRKEALKIVNALRDEGVNCDSDVSGKKLGKLLEYASSLSIPYAIIVGEKELKKKAVVLRNMKNGKERTVKIKDLAGMLNSGDS